jgi:ribonuclease Z
MHVTFLGTGGAVPTTERNTSALCLRREDERFLFDCGEGTQRQMMRFGTGFDLSHVFLTHTHGDHVFGLPGLVQTLDFNDREAPLAIHCPASERSTVERLLRPTGARTGYPVRVNGVRADDVALDGDGYEVRAIATDHDTPSVGWALIEADRKGRFDREKAEEELGIPPGPKYGRLHAGEPVEHEGEVIQPEAVVGPPRPGRRIVYTGDTRPTRAVREAAADADLLIHDATFASDHADRAAPTGHSTAREAGVVADDAGATRLALVHVSSRYAGDVSPIAREARETFDGEAFVPDDGDELDVTFPDEE